ncbi:SusC/RagA family TonB-linked outer membrane protein [Chitinophaga arvensicola]|uniref:TonB-linked outer membrane protein, SusC/RagA family n=1 Tax=Chitinophaga arvensicola TaxID=29529 RepID=A0A1I0RQF8_9BACT|nr:SusC/RagA family TonB-linked outer membrane protein [Chitinophaga arvensicola]SEW43334.1 TonB-linked outer membrane protein, SusC/RagA family [Chitinophaga arvensicola]
MQKISRKFWLLLLCSIVAMGAYAQADKNAKRTPLSQALADITRQYDTRFVFDADLIRNKSTNITVAALKNLPVEEVLKRVLYPSNLLFVYVSENNYMLIQRPVQSRPASVQQLAPEENAVAVDNHLTGVITDAATREPLTGVTVRLVNTGKGVMTDQNGRYTFSDVPAGSNTLRASFIGYTTRELTAGGTVASFSLVPDTRTLDEVKVVEVGYGTKRREAITGAVTSVNNKTITQLPSAMLSNNLVGTVPGLFGKQSGGSPGNDNSRLLVRSSSFYNTPLIVIDGVPLNDNSNTSGFSGQAGLNDIDPADLESVTVLKDAASTAIYGSRGGNGVILVTTRRGKISRPKFSFAANTLYSRPTQQPKFVDNYQQALLENESSVNSGKEPIYSAAVLDTIRLGLNPDKYANTDWRKATMHDYAGSQNYNLNVSGGNEAVKYYVSGGYNKQGSLVGDAAFKRYSLISNIDTRLNKNLTMGLDMAYRYDMTDEPSAGGSNTIMVNSYMMSPLQPIYFSNGLPAANYTGTINNTVVQMTQSGYSRKYGNYLNAKLKMDYALPFVPGLSAHAMASFDRNNYGTKSFSVPYKLYRANALGQYVPVSGVDNKGVDLKPSLTEGMNRANYTNMEFGFNYKRSFGLHSLEGVLLYTTNESSIEILSASRSNIFSPAVDELFAGNAASNSTNNGTTQEFGRVGYVGRLSYSYNGKYYLDGSFRSEASVNYADGHRWGVFPSVSAGWRISEEPFIKDNISWIDELKLRCSYGMAGDESGAGYSAYLYNFSVGQNTGPNSTVGKNGYVFGGNYSPSVYPGLTAPNTGITWGVIKSFNAGFNMSILKGLFAAEFDVYQKKNTNILISVTDNVPLTYGANTPRLNMGSNHTNGFELTLTHSNTIGKNFSYYVKGMIAHTKTITDYSGEQAGLPSWDKNQLNGWGANVTRIYKSLGLFQSKEEVAGWAIQDGRNNTTLQPGDIKYADLNGDGIIDQKDVIVKDNISMPLLNYGFSLGATWKKLALDLTFQGIGDYTNIYLYKRWTNYDSRQLDRWTPDNPNGSWPQLGISGSDGRTSDFYGTTSNYLRLRSARLSYTLQPAWLKQAGLDAVVFNLQGGNLLLFSKVKFADPENDNLVPYGPQKTYGIGATVRF